MRVIKALCLIVGSLLVLSSAVFLAVRRSVVTQNAQEIEQYVDTLYDIIPTPHAAVLEPRGSNNMPSLDINGQSFVALLGIPSFELTLPVGEAWESNERFPSRYTGSIYDGSLIVGTSNQKGQLDIVKELSVDDVLTLTDMTGDCFSYRITSIKYSKHADNETLQSDNASFTLFVKNIYAFEYIIIRCEPTV